MSLALALKKAGIHWTLDLVEVPTPSNRYPDVTHQVPFVRVQLLDNSSPSNPVTYEEVLYPGSTDLTVERALSFVLRHKLPDHPVFKAWLESKGQVPVVLIESNLGENLGECIHTAVRKRVDSPESAIQWNAINHLLPGDWAQLLEYLRFEIRELQGQVKANALPHLTRYAIGEAIQKVFSDSTGSVERRINPKTKLPVQRTDLEKFALMTLKTTCQATDLQDFVWGWAAFLCKDLANNPEPTDVVVDTHAQGEVGQKSFSN